MRSACLRRYACPKVGLAALQDWIDITLEQLGYQAESGPWRNAYLSAALELRSGNSVGESSAAKTNGDIAKNMTASMLFDYMAVLLDKQAMADKDIPYVFPILTSTDTKEAYEEYQVAINNHNRLLRRLSKMLPVGCKLTSYTSRHSWATAARNHNVPISVISAGMGHTSEQTTQIYLTMLENSVIDDANLGLIRSLLE